MPPPAGAAQRGNSRLVSAAVAGRRTEGRTDGRTAGRTHDLEDVAEAAPAGHPEDGRPTDRPAPSVRPPASSPPASQAARARLMRRWATGCPASVNLSLSLLGRKLSLFLSLCFVPSSAAPHDHLVAPLSSSTSSSSSSSPSSSLGRSVLFFRALWDRRSRRKHLQTLGGKESNRSSSSFSYHFGGIRGGCC
jgi:hypothetical protein